MATTQTHTLLEAALAYAAKGLHVIPLHDVTTGVCSCGTSTCKPGKHPRLAAWTTAASTDPGQIRAWWQQWPTANVGIQTGARSGLAVLDVDPRHGGAVALEELLAQHGPLPETPLVLTGGGGQHYYFRLEADLPGCKPAPGLDLQLSGQQVAAPPSLHPSGQRYTWEASSDLAEVPLAPLPAWLQAMAEAKATASTHGVPLPDVLPVVALQDLTVSTRLKYLIQTGEDPDLPTRYQSRSEALFAAIRGLVRAGYDDATIAGVVMDRRYAISAKAWDQKNPRSPRYEGQARGWVAGEIGRARAKVQAPTADRTVPDMTQDAAQRHNGDAPGPPEKAPPLPYSDYTNALAFVRDHGANLRYCYPWQSWLVWTGTYWQRDTSGAVMRLAKQTVKRLARQAESLPDAMARALLTHVKASLSTAKLKALVENAQSEPGIAVQPEDLDTNPWLLNVANGTLDLKTGQLRDHAREDLLTVMLPVVYDATAACPTWGAFLDRIMAGNENLITFLQRVIGYALTGVIREHVLLILYGTGRNGKSTFLNLLRRLLGSYAMKAPPELLMVSNNDRHPTERADLFGKRFVSAIETEQGRRLSEVFVKEATGGDNIRARRMREDFWEFQPTHKVFLATNHKPVISGTETAIRERIRLVPFAVTIPDGERDTTLAKKLNRNCLVFSPGHCGAVERAGAGPGLA